MKQVIYLFIIWRIVLFLVALISPQIIPQFGARFPYYQERLIDTGLPHFVWAFGNFDGVHYLRIAQDGYAYQFTQAFFPLYPILIKIVSYATFGNFLIAALLISNASFLAGLLIFYRLVTKIYNAKIAFWSMLFLLSFPTSFYFGSVYTEGVFFLIIVSAFYLFAQDKILWASVIGSFASATRLIGLFLTPALIKNFKIESITPLIIVPAGLVIYMIYLKLAFNNPFYFLTAQSIWGQERSTSEVILLPQVFWRYLKIFATTEGLVLANAALEFIATVFALWLLIVGAKKINRNWLIFASLAIVVPTLTGTLASMPRYVLMAFPVYIILAQIENRQIKILILAIFSALLFVTTTLFTQGYWIA